MIKTSIIGASGVLFALRQMFLSSNLKLGVCTPVEKNAQSMKLCITRMHFIGERENVSQ